MGSCYSTVGERRGSGEAGAEPSSSASPNRSRRQRWKKGGSRRSSGGGDGEFHGIAGRMVMNGIREAACLYTQQGKKGTNQDAMIVWENFSSRGDTIFCGVFDGHGPYGHMVARKIRDMLPVMLSTQWSANTNGDQNSLSEPVTDSGCTNSEETASLSLDDECYESFEVGENGKVPEMYWPLKQSILKAFKLMDKELKLNPIIDCFCSGSTAVTLVKQGLDLILGNVGDSRAILATRDNENALVAVQLTVDLKPDLPREAARIKECKGRVFALQDEPEVARVWLPHNDSPGLAMARAFGDFCLKDFGLIAVPDVYYRRLTERDEFIILATDGIWDVLSNKEAIDIVSSAPGRATAARALVDTAVRAWKLKYPTSKNDDCAVVCLFLDHTSPSNQPPGSDNPQNSPDEAFDKMAATKNSNEAMEINGESHAAVLEHSGTQRGCNEIEPVVEAADEKVSPKSHDQSKRSLAECLSTTEDEEWSALEGVTRVNSLLSLPRFLSSDKRSASWRKWL